MLGAYHQFRRSRWRRRPQIGHEVANREVGLVSDGRDHRQTAFGDGARQRFVVECGQILERPAAAGNDDDINLPARG